MFRSRQNYLGPFFKKQFCLIISWCCKLIEDEKHNFFEKKTKLVASLDWL